MKSISAPRKLALQEEQLDIIIGYACNANCPHCIQDIRYQSAVAEDDYYFKQLRRVLDYYFNEIGGQRIIITGGEPSIFPNKLLGILRMLRNYPQPEFIASYTNGSGLLRRCPGENRSLLEMAAAEGLTDINLSVHHYKPESNRAFMRLKKLPDPNSIAAECKRLGVDLRLNCNLIGEYVGNLAEVVSYLQWAKTMGPKDVYFRDLHRIHNAPVSTQFAKVAEKVLYIDEQRIDFDGLVKQMLSSPEFQYCGRWGNKHAGQGEQYNFVYDELPVKVGYINIGNEVRSEVTYFVFAPDGKLYGDWNGPASLHNTPINLDSQSEVTSHERIQKHIPCPGAA